METNKKQRMKELVDLLNQASKAYYQDAVEIMSNFEYDKLYDELLELEAELDTVLSDSPTINVGYEVLSELPKERHESPMLSLDKTKEISELKRFVGNHDTLISWKMDGLTIVLTYRDGDLFKAVTRGNGEIGEIVTNNAKVFKNVPLKIPYKGELVLRGEAVISYENFEKINAEIEDVTAKYKNPRNLCSGSVRQLNNEITAKRNVEFYAFTLVSATDMDFENSRAYQFEWLKAQGFQVVDYRVVNADTLEETVAWFSGQIATNPFPSDGLVVAYDDIAYGKSLGRTAKFPRDSFAFKWADEIKDTTLLEIEWSPSRTGLINPVAIFEPIELEGTTVSRASVHNISIMEELELGIGDTIQVYKANMIIPQIAENLTRSGLKDVPKICPVCSGATEVRRVANAKALYCTNPECQAKHVKAFTHCVSRDALNIEGMSEATLEKFISCGFIKEYADLFHLDRYKEQIVEMEGFGEKSYENMIQSTKKASTTTMPRMLYCLGIANVGLVNAKVICKEYKNDFDQIVHATEEALTEIEGIGPIIAASVVSYFADEKKRKDALDLLAELTIPREEENTNEQILEGKKFVITGSLNHYENRDAMKARIEELGGKVIGSVSKKTDYLINNDVLSTSSKNKKANELGIPILSEDDFIEMIGGM